MNAVLLNLPDTANTRRSDANTRHPEWFLVGKPRSELVGEGSGSGLVSVGPAGLIYPLAGISLASERFAACDA